MVNFISVNGDDKKIMTVTQLKILAAKIGLMKHVVELHGAAHTGNHIMTVIRDASKADGKIWSNVRDYVFNFATGSITIKYSRKANKPDASIPLLKNEVDEAREAEKGRRSDDVPTQKAHLSGGESESDAEGLPKPKEAWPERGEAVAQEELSQLILSAPGDAMRAAQEATTPSLERVRSGDVTGAEYGKYLLRIPANEMTAAAELMLRNLRASKGRSVGRLAGSDSPLPREPSAPTPPAPHPSLASTRPLVSIESTQPLPTSSSRSTPPLTPKSLLEKYKKEQDEYKERIKNENNEIMRLVKSMEGKTPEEKVKIQREVENRKNQIENDKAALNKVHTKIRNIHEEDLKKTIGEMEKDLKQHQAYHGKDDRWKKLKEDIERAQHVYNAYDRYFDMETNLEELRQDETGNADAIAKLLDEMEDIRQGKGLIQNTDSLKKFLYGPAYNTTHKKDIENSEMVYPYNFKHNTDTTKLLNLNVGAIARELTSKPHKYSEQSFKQALNAAYKQGNFLSNLKSSNLMLHSGKKYNYVL